METNTRGDNVVGWEETVLVNPGLGGKQAWQFPEKISPDYQTVRVGNIICDLGSSTVVFDSRTLPYLIPNKLFLKAYLWRNNTNEPCKITPQTRLNFCERNENCNFTTFVSWFLFLKTKGSLAEDGKEATDVKRVSVYSVQIQPCLYVPSHKLKLNPVFSV
jgi:hypothetical protein